MGEIAMTATADQGKTSAHRREAERLEEGALYSSKGHFNSAVIIKHLTYDHGDDKFDLDIFTADLTKQDFSKAGDKLQPTTFLICTGNSPR